MSVHQEGFPDGNNVPGGCKCEWIGKYQEGFPDGNNVPGGCKCEWIGKCAKCVIKSNSYDTSSGISIVTHFRTDPQENDESGRIHLFKLFRSHIEFTTISVSNINKLLEL